MNYLLSISIRISWRYLESYLGFLGCHAYDSFHVFAEGKFLQPGATKRTIFPM